MSRGPPDLKTSSSSTSHLAGLVNLGLLCALLHHQSQGVHCVQDLLEGQLDLQENEVGFSNVGRISPHPDRFGTLRSSSVTEFIIWFRL